MQIEALEAEARAAESAVMRMLRKPSMESDATIAFLQLHRALDARRRCREKVAIERVVVAPRRVS